MMNKLFITSFLLLMMQLAANAQADSAALAKADTTGFSVNRQGGWNLYNSYVAAKGSDSAILEVILLHSSALDWQDEYYIGRIKKQEHYPVGERMFSVDLIVKMFAIRITSDGKCYLRLSSGAPPTEDPIVIPIQGDYKIND